MRILLPTEEEIRLRDVRAAGPLISRLRPEKIPKQRLNRAFSRKYIAKLADKVHRQAPEAHRTGLDARLNVSREKFRYGSDRLVEVLQNGTKDDARSAI